MKRVRDLLREKDTDMWSVAPDDTVYDAIKLMADKNIGAVLVLDGGRLVGLLSERDYARKITLENRRSRETAVRDVMTTHVAYAEPSETLEECMALMTDKRFRHLPVMEDDTLIGVLSIGDLVKAVIAEQRFLIKQLEHYISGG
ncbi:inosine-5-monophosphate dehydrogenase [Salinisphaera orenii MK-B5]|uniref:Inosine-5-monophosphate dehydrogenase n=1 Tax=Salinisphaera orenii MK-B5 TaxID=856730 RepID=A0A423PTE0_9GAMM|nr:CBS domain-containing protein [Salinisphaera orenii]ROO28854.1 inosine-5-monophosphate dehydrogenase [Salinisphaera orenii MK-B5]